MTLATSPQKLLNSLSHGKVYRREDLLLLSKSVDRDLNNLKQKGKLQKVGAGLYLYPKNSKWGFLPAEPKELAKSFLKTSDFLIISNNHYNALGLGMTQLWNETRVYNKRRHQKLELGGMMFNFQMPYNGYPKHLTIEFLFVDLLNNISKCGESPAAVKEKISKGIHNFDSDLLLKLAKKYGKLGTKQYFSKLLSNG